METRFLRRIVDTTWFALTDMLLVIISGLTWMFIPKFGPWFTLIAVLPWGFRWWYTRRAFQRTPFNWLIAIFLVTAWVGYWASYDKTTAWVKVWLVMTAILLYFALSAQPKQNLELLSLLSFALGICLSLYFFLTYDFSVGSGSLGSGWRSIRPEVSWPSIPHGHTSGLITITSIFAVYGIWSSAKKSNGLYSIVTKLLIILGITTIFSAFVLSWSRGILVVGIAVLGVWMLWKVSTLGRFVAKPRMRSPFPSLVLLSLAAVIIMVYLGPARMGGAIQGKYGKNTRAELFARGAQFLVDYPITGAGMNSFSGLYSQYMIVIPAYYFLNSYNLFLDVAIEQGLIGGLAFIFLYLGSVWLVSQTIVKTSSEQIRFFSWLSLFALIVTIIHGLLYDYLYNNRGTLLLFFPIGLSMIGVLSSNSSKHQRIQLLGAMPVSGKINIRIMLIMVTGLIAVLALNINKLISIWYANLGAVQMSQIELRNFPTHRWIGTEIAASLEGSEALFLSALQYDPNNRTANHRLGLISMLRQDFNIASVYLEKAYKASPGHRGIIKNLAYCYVWLGEIAKASELLSSIREAQSEMNVYRWWWVTQGRPDLSKNASLIVFQQEAPSQ